MVPKVNLKQCVSLLWNIHDCLLWNSTETSNYTTFSGRRSLTGNNTTAKEFLSWKLKQAKDMVPYKARWPSQACHQTSGHFYLVCHSIWGDKGYVSSSSPYLSLWSVFLLVKARETGPHLIPLSGRKWENQDILYRSSLSWQPLWRSLHRSLAV